ncbi:hypothetical protein [Streptomyces sp. NPDC059258]
MGEFYQPVYPKVVKLPQQPSHVRSRNLGDIDNARPLNAFPEFEGVT